MGLSKNSDEVQGVNAEIFVHKNARTFSKNDF